MSVEEIVQLILSTRKELTRDEILNMINRKMELARGFLTREAAARIVASELGIDIQHKPLPSRILVKNIVSGLNDVTVAGRVITVHPTQKFKRSDGSEGAVSSLVMADNTGVVRVVLWDEKANMVENVRQGDILKVLHGYAREGRDGGIEIHVGLGGDIQINPPDVPENECPPISIFMSNIGDLKDKTGRVNVTGMVKHIFPPSEFVRKDGSKGRVMRLELEDETGQVMVVLWNEKVKEAGEVKEGDYLQLMNVKVKKQTYGEIELHTENSTQLQVIPKEAVKLSIKFLEIGKIKPNMKNVNILARITHVGKVRTFKRRGGGENQVLTLLVKDETGKIRVNLWGDKAKTAEGAKPGDTILVEGGYIRERFGRISVNVGEDGNIMLNPPIPEAEQLPPHKEHLKKVVEIKMGDGPLTVDGIVSTPPIIREVVTGKGEKVKVASFTLKDETGEIGVSLWRELAELMDKIKVGDRIRVKNVYAKTGFADRLELTSSALTSIEFLHKDGDN